MPDSSVTTLPPSMAQQVAVKKCIAMVESQVAIALGWVSRQETLVMAKYTSGTTVEVLTGGVLDVF